MAWNVTIIPIEVETSAIVISPTMCLRRNSYTTITPTTGTITPTTLFLVPTTQRYQRGQFRTIGFTQGELS